MLKDQKMNKNSVNMIPSININKLISTLTFLYVNAIKNKTDFNLLPSIMLWGQPGIGKSQAVYEVADNIEKETGKEVIVTDIRLILFSPVDLRGLPTKNKEGDAAIWLKPKILDLDSSPDKINILFLDEITSCTPSLQTVAYQITLDKKIGEHTLPKNTIVILAGNRTIDKSVSYRMPKALANRLIHFDVTNNLPNFKKWALKEKIHPYVISFLEFKNVYLNTFDSDKEQIVFATPRSWEMVSNILNNISSDIDNIYPLISGIIGTGLAIEFKAFVKNSLSMPSISKIFDGTEEVIPTETSLLYSVTSSIIDYVKEKEPSITQIENSIKYGLKLPADFQVLLFKQYMNISFKMKEKLYTIPVFQKWLIKNGSIFNVI